MTDGNNAKVMTAVTGSIEMDYIRLGAGKRTFVILPGIGFDSVIKSASAIGRLFADFTDEYTVYLFDRKKSFNDGYTVEDMAEDTAKVMATLGLSGTYMYGASQGGMMAMCIAAYHQSLVEKLVLGSTCSRPNTVVRTCFPEWISLARSGKKSMLVKNFYKRLYSDELLKSIGEIPDDHGNTENDEGLERFAVMSEACLEFDFYDRLDMITCPTLVIGVENDSVLSGEASKEIADKIGCDLYMYGGGYHHAVFDEAADYYGRVRAFFDKAQQ